MLGVRSHACSCPVLARRRLPRRSGAASVRRRNGDRRVDHVYDGEFEFFVGGGVAAFDCNDDGRAELYFAGGSEPAALYRNDSPAGGALRFAQLAVGGHRPDRR